MNHAGEITPLTRLVRPHVAIITTIEPVHLEYFGSVEAIADAKAEIFAGLEPGGAAVLNRDNPQFARLPTRARARRRRARRLVRRARRSRCAADQVRRCSRNARPCRRASSARRSPTSSARRAAISCSTRSPCWRRRRSPAPTSRWPRWRSPMLQPPAGRGARMTLELPDGDGAADRRKLQRQSGLDARRARAARPGRRSAARAGASRCSATCWNSGRDGAALHRGLAEPIVRTRRRSRVLRRPADASAVGGASLGAAGRLCGDAAALEPQVLAAVRDGDAVMVKGSLGSRMGPIVKALDRALHATRRARSRAPAQG